MPRVKTMGNGIIFVEAGNCAGLTKSSKEQRVERESKINHKTALMNSEEWVAAGSANFLVSFTSGNFKDTEQITSRKAGHILPGGVSKSVTTHRPSPSPSPALCPYLLTHSGLVTVRETPLILWREGLSNFMLSTSISSPLPTTPTI